MMKKLVIFLLLCMGATNLYAVDDYIDDFDDYGIYTDDNFDFDEFAVTETGTANTDTAPDVLLINSDATSANVAGFDIAGVMLGMDFDDVSTLFYTNRGIYAPRKKNSIIYSIHKDWKYNLDYECRQQGIIIPEKLDRCIKTLAKNRGLLYASEMHLVRESTGETLDVYFTSNATDNVVWRVVYSNDVNELEGQSEKFENQREKKILAFWQNVLDKYGAPNSGTDKWATSDNAYDPLMTAYYGMLELVDHGSNTVDETANITQARKNFKAKSYAF